MGDLYDEPRCADSEWGLYNNHFWDDTPGYFCCASDSRGYNQTSEFSNGCAESNAELEDDEEWLPLVGKQWPPGTSPPLSIEPTRATMCGICGMRES